MILNWTPHFSGRGKEWVLELEGAEGELGRCYRAGKRQWEAWAEVRDERLSHFGSYPSQAMERLEAELDRRSIGLFGVDEIEFHDHPEETWRELAAVTRRRRRAARHFRALLTAEEREAEGGR